MSDSCRIINCTSLKVNNNTKNISLTLKKVNNNTKKIKSKSNFLIRSVNIDQNKKLVVTNVSTPECIKSSNGVILTINSNISDIKCLENYTVDNITDNSFDIITNFTNECQITVDATGSVGTYISMQVVD